MRLRILEWLNWYVFQWFFFRLASVVDDQDRHIRYDIIWGAAPLSGWWIKGVYRPYRYPLRKGK